MITWLPTPSFKASARMLSDKHLKQQRADVLGILIALYLYPEDGISPVTGRVLPGFGHPAIAQWKGYERPLMTYGVDCCDQWIARGNDCRIRPRLFGFLGKIMTQYDLDFDDLEFPAEDPPWLCNPRLHSSHRAALLLKEPEWYSRYEWVESPSCSIWWPHEANQRFLRKTKLGLKT